MEPMTPVLPTQSDTLQLEVILAKDQPEYRPLPVIITSDGTVISRWNLNWKERLQILFNGNVFLRQLTFNQPLQPQLLTIEEPEVTLG